MTSNLTKVEKGLADLSLREERIGEPAKAWRNRYWSPNSGISVQGIPYEAGEGWGAKLYPSKDVAESAAAKSMADNIRRCLPCKYLGAFPLTSDS